MKIKKLFIMIHVLVQIIKAVAARFDSKRALFKEMKAKMPAA